MTPQPFCELRRPCTSIFPPLYLFRHIPAEIKSTSELQCVHKLIGINLILLFIHVPHLKYVPNIANIKLEDVTRRLGNVG